MIHRMIVSFAALEIGAMNALKFAKNVKLAVTLLMTVQFQQIMTPLKTAPFVHGVIIH
jgi:hypothetical protein